jgi:hypothetical protein
LTKNKFDFHVQSEHIHEEMLLASLYKFRLGKLGPLIQFASGKPKTNLAGIILCTNRVITSTHQLKLMRTIRVRRSQKHRSLPCNEPSQASLCFTGEPSKQVISPTIHGSFQTNGSTMQPNWGEASN